MGHNWQSPLSEAQIKELLPACQQMLADGREVEEVLAFLRRETGSKIHSIFILVHLLGLPLAEAKERVDLSATWQDVFERDLAFHEALSEAVEREGR
jgi:ribosomal protein L7/L12